MKKNKISDIEVRIALLSKRFLSSQEVAFLTGTSWFDVRKKYKTACVGGIFKRYATEDVIDINKTISKYANLLATEKCFTRIEINAVETSNNLVVSNTKNGLDDRASDGLLNSKKNK